MRVKTLLSALGGLAAALVPQTGLMAVISVPDTLPYPCMFALPCTSGGAIGIASYIETTIFGGAQIVFLAAAIILFAQYGMRLMLESNEESTISEVKSAYSYAIAGCAFMTLASFIVRVVGQGKSTGVPVDPAALDTTLGYITDFFRVMVGTAVTAVVVYQGMRMIALQGQESELEKQKTRLFHSLIGVAVITLATAVVTDFLPGTGSSNLVLEMVGIANFLMEIIGAIAVLSFIVAGIMLIVSTDEALKDRAKKTMFTTVIGLIVLIAAYTIVNFVINLNAAGLGAYPT
jgi:cytochrome bd-type quinol oxidase subunit 2